MQPGSSLDLSGPRSILRQDQSVSELDNLKGAEKDHPQICSLPITLTALSPSMEDWGFLSPRDHLWKPTCPQSPLYSDPRSPCFCLLYFLLKPL